MSVTGNQVDVLDVTLRDGSYLIDFQFTAEDTAMIASALASAGIQWIELGHGLGLNASASGHGQAAASDEDYLEAAARVLPQARWGMFFIPGIGREEDLRLAARYRMPFVRIGTNITDVEAAERYFRLARELGLIVTWNSMKSYVVTPAEFGRKTALVRSWGADVAYLVDSAGGMYPDDVVAYLKAAREVSDIALGFHGHDNLSLAMANTLRAIEGGAVLLDSSLQGMGRSAGNAVTEVLVAILKQRGGLPGVDLNGVMDIGQGLIQPLMGRRGLDPMSVTAGYARFHSSFTAKVESYAQKYKLDARDLIVRLCQEDQVTAPDALLEQISRELAGARVRRVIAIPAAGPAAARPVHGQVALLSLLKDLRPQAVKRCKFSALNLVIGERSEEEILVSRNIQESATHVVGSVALTSQSQLDAVLGAVDGSVDVVLLDVDRNRFGIDAPAETARRTLRHSLLLTYLDSRVWVDAVEDQVVRLLGESLDAAVLVIAGDHPKSRLLALRFAERGAQVALLEQGYGETTDASAEALRTLALDPGHMAVVRVAAGSPEAKRLVAAARAVVVWPRQAPWFGAGEADELAARTFVLDARIGGLRPDGSETALRRGARLIRVNIWPTLTAALTAAHESARVCSEALGWGTLADVPVVAGGAMGQPGDVVVDSLHEPTRVIGVADGRGSVLFTYDPDHAERVRRVSAEITRQMLQPRMKVADPV